MLQPPVEEQQSNRTTQNSLNRDKNLFFCPHDLSASKEFRDDLPTLLNGQDSNDGLATKLNVSEKSSLSVFDTPENSDVSVVSLLDFVAKTKKFLSFYCRMSRPKTN